MEENDMREASRQRKTVNKEIEQKMKKFLEQKMTESQKKKTVNSTKK